MWLWWWMKTTEMWKSKKGTWGKWKKKFSRQKGLVCIRSHSILVSLRNRVVGRRGRQNAYVWQTWQGYYLRALSWSSLDTNVFWIFTKKICLKEGEVWRKVISNKIIAMLVTQGLPLRKSTINDLRAKNQWTGTTWRILMYNESGMKYNLHDFKSQAS